MKYKGTVLAARLVALVALGVLAARQTDSPRPLRAAGDHLFTQTGYTVPAPFMDYWERNGGLAIFGYPLTPLQWEGQYQVQYFERNRFELHPAANGGSEVLLGLLGTMLTSGRNFPTSDPIPETADQKYFVPTGHRLSGVFYQYWKVHGGLALFGYPISEEIAEGGYKVQYFQRNRFEYHPEHAGTPYEVELGLLGRDYLKLVQSGQTPQPSTPAPAGTPAAPVPTAQVSKPTSDPNHPAPPDTSGPPLPPVDGDFKKGPHLGYGMIVHMYYQDHNRILNAVKDIGFNWIKQQVQWSDIESPKGTYYWGELDTIVNDCNAAGVNVLLSVVRTPPWAGKGLPDNAQDLGDFMRALAARYAGRVKAYEIWNEENLAVETAGQHWHPERYAEMLKAAYVGVKSVAPDAVVVSGALTPTGVYNDAAVEETYYLDQLYQWHDGELRNYYDALGMHPYGYWNPPDTMYPVQQPADQTPASEFRNHGQFYFRRIEDQRAVMVKHGEAQKQIWITEFGWCSDKRAGGYTECLNNSLDDQAAYTVRAFEKAYTDYPFMGVMFLWNLNFSTFQEWYTGPSHFSVLNPDWSPRPVYWALKNMPKR